MKNLKILVCGDREWKDEDIIYEWLESFNESIDWLEITLIHGAARGADSIADKIARSFAWHVKPYPADWETLGKKAGPMRNREMLKEKPDIVLAFHTDLKNSKGTKDMVLLSVKEGIETHLITG
jgi:hypothetical protein